MTETPLYIKVHGDDNVAIVVNPLGLPPGTEFPCGLVLRDFVPQGHKVALADVAEGAPIIRYGEMIGTAARTIPKGSRIEESAVRLPTAPPLDSLPLAINIPAPPQSCRSLRWKSADGRPDGLRATPRSSCRW